MAEFTKSDRPTSRIVRNASPDTQTDDEAEALYLDILVNTPITERTPLTPKPEPKIVPHDAGTPRYSEEAQREIDYWSKF